MRLYRVAELTAQRRIRDADAVYTALTESTAVDLGEYWPALHYTLSGEGRCRAM